MTSWEDRDKSLERGWKWMLRGLGIGAFLFVLIAMKGEAPLGAYIIIGGCIGLPNVLSLQQALNSKLTGDIGESGS